MTRAARAPLSPTRLVLRSVGIAVAVLVAVSLLWAIEAGSPKKSPPSGVDGLSVPWNAPAPERFVDAVDHPWLEFTPGSRRVFANANDSLSRQVLQVAEQTRQVAGIDTTVVTHESGDAEGSVTVDVAQDVDGNVWVLALSVANAPQQSWSVAHGSPAGLLLPAVPRRGDGHAVAAPSPVGASGSTANSVTVRLTVEGHEDDRLAVRLRTVPQREGDHPRTWNVVLEKGTGPVSISSASTGTASLIRE